jgi:tetratricopeptide (TPR) repeat protein
VTTIGHDYWYVVSQWLGVSEPSLKTKLWKVLSSAAPSHLQRAEILRDQNRSGEALADLEAVMQSPVNFSGTIPETLLLRGQIHFDRNEEQQALQDFMSVLEQDDSAGWTIAEAYLGSGAVLASPGEHDEARLALTAAAKHPEAGEAVRRQADRMLLSMEGN